MRILLGVVVLAAVLWSSYWFVGAHLAETRVSAWFEERRDDGWVADLGAIDVQGFPNRFDVTLDDVELADPSTGVAWQAPSLYVLMLSYRPNRVIVIWPETQSLATPLTRMAVTSEDMRASMSARGTDWRLDQIIVEADAMTFEGQREDWQAALDDGQIALRQHGDDPAAYQIAVDLGGLILPEGTASLLSRPDLAGREVQTATLRAAVTFDRQWDYRALEQRRPQPTRIAIDTARVTWGELDLQLAGRVDVGADGVPTGEVTIRATNWRQILQMLDRAGLLPPQVAGLLERGIARVAGDSNRLDLPLQLRDGGVYLAGLIPVGPAPRLQLR